MASVHWTTLFEDNLTNTVAPVKPTVPKQSIGAVILCHYSVREHVKGAVAKLSAPVELMVH